MNDFITISCYTSYVKRRVYNKIMKLMLLLLIFTIINVKHDTVHIKNDSMPIKIAPKEIRQENILNKKVYNIISTTTKR